MLIKLGGRREKEINHSIPDGVRVEIESQARNRQGVRNYALQGEPLTYFVHVSACHGTLLHGIILRSVVVRLGIEF